MNDSEQQKDGGTPEAPSGFAEAIKEQKGVGGRKKSSRRAGYIGNIVWNLIFLFVLNNLVNWHVPFIAPSWVAVLWAINLSLGTTILANIVFLAFDPRWFRHAAQIVLNLLALLSTYVIYIIFPFELPGEPVTLIFRVCLIIAMVVTAIGIVIELVKLVLNRD